MPRIKMDLSNVEVGGPRVPPGQYVAELLDCEEKESSTGNPMLEWEWEISDGDHEGQTVRSWTSLQEHALFGFKGHLIGLGEDADDVDIDTDDLIGRKAILTIGERRYKDKESGEERTASSVERVDVYKRPSKSGKKATRRQAREVDETEEVPF